MMEQAERIHGWIPKAVFVVGVRIVRGTKEQVLKRFNRALCGCEVNRAKMTTDPKAMTCVDCLVELDRRLEHGTVKVTRGGRIRRA